MASWPLEKGLASLKSSTTSGSIDLDGKHTHTDAQRLPDINLNSLEVSATFKFGTAGIHLLHTRVNHLTQAVDGGGRRCGEIHLWRL